MKILFYDDFKLGVLKDRHVVDASPLLEDLDTSTPQNTLQSMITRFKEKEPQLVAIAEKNHGVPVESVRIRQPVPRPQVLLCAITNYMEGVGKRPEPDFFLKSPYSIIGDGDTVVLPSQEAQIFHHEAELAVVMSKSAEHLGESEAMDYVFGYTGFIDVSARGLSRSYFKNKSFHTFAPLGPVIVTKDEIPDPYDLDVKMWVNGQPRHDYNTGDMANRIPRLLEEATAVTRLDTGDVVCTGTNHQGIGPLQDGEEVVLEIEKIGRLTVHVRDDKKRKWAFGIDQEMARKVREF